MGSTIATFLNLASENLNLIDPLHEEENEDGTPPPEQGECNMPPFENRERNALKELDSPEIPKLAEPPNHMETPKKLDSPENPKLAEPPKQRENNDPKTLFSGEKPKLTARAKGKTSYIQRRKRLHSGGGTVYGGISGGASRNIAAS